MGDQEGSSSWTFVFEGNPSSPPDSPESPTVLASLSLNGTERAVIPNANANHHQHHVPISSVAPTRPNPTYSVNPNMDLPNMTSSPNTTKTQQSVGIPAPLQRTLTPPLSQPHYNFQQSPQPAIAKRKNSGKGSSSSQTKWKFMGSRSKVHKVGVHFDKHSQYMGNWKDGQEMPSPQATTTAAAVTLDSPVLLRPRQQIRRSAANAPQRASFPSAIDRCSLPDLGTQPESFSNRTNLKSNSLNLTENINSNNSTNYTNDFQNDGPMPLRYHGSYNNIMFPTPGLSGPSHSHSNFSNGNNHSNININHNHNNNSHNDDSAMPMPVHRSASVDSPFIYRHNNEQTQMAPSGFPSHFHNNVYPEYQSHPSAMQFQSSSSSLFSSPHNANLNNHSNNQNNNNHNSNNTSSHNRNQVYMDPAIGTILHLGDNNYHYDSNTSHQLLDLYNNHYPL